MMLLGSRAMRRLLIYFALFPDREVHLRALQRETNLAIASLQTELPRLEEMGLVRRSTSGRLVRYAANPSHRAWPALRAMIRSFAGIPEVLRIALGPVDGVEAAFVFGSHPRGDSSDESDVDLLVVGDEVPRGELTRHAQEASMLLGREVNPLLYSPAELADRAEGGSRFVNEVLRGPKWWIVGDGQQLGME